MEKKGEVSKVKCDFFKLPFPLSSEESEIDVSGQVATSSQLGHGSQQRIQIRILDSSKCVGGVGGRKVNSYLRDV